MKIGIISTFVGQKTAGAEISTLLLTKLLAEKNDVFIITTKVKEEMPCRAYDLSVSLVPNIVLMIGTKVSNWWMEYKIKKILRQEKPDVIHIQDFSIMPPAVSAAKELKIPIVMTVRDFRHRCNLSTCFENGKLGDECCDSKKGYLNCLNATFREMKGGCVLAFLFFPIFYAQRKLFRSMLTRIDSFIAVSNFVKNELVRSGVSIKRIKTILVPAPHWKIEKAVLNKKVVFFAPGLLVYGKGFQIIIAAFVLAQKKVPNLCLRIAGEGGYKTELERMAKGMAEDVYFLGKLKFDEMQREYSNADIVVQASIIPESLSRVLFEAYAVKKPIIASDAGGNSELVKSGKTGFLVKKGDIKGMARSMLRLAKSKKLRNKLGNNGYKQVLNKGGDNDIVNSHMQVYQKLTYS